MDRWLDCLFSSLSPSQALSGLHGGFAALDASQPWILYWILHSLALLDADLGNDESDEELLAWVTSLIAACQDGVAGGFGGGPHQLPHLAATYAGETDDNDSDSDG